MTTPELTLTRMIDAIERVDVAALASVFAEDVQLRASIPRKDVERTGRAEAAALMAGWFADATKIRRVGHGVDLVADVWHAYYRFTLFEEGLDRVVEQHAFCSLVDGLIAKIRVICSGFRPIAVTQPGDAAAMAHAHLDALGEGCATLTPRIAAAVRAMQPGEVLAVLTDDPGAPDGIAAWSRMTGHAVVAMSSEPHGTRIHLRRKETS